MPDEAMYQGYSLAELDAQLDRGRVVPGAAEVIEQYARLGARAIARLDARRDVRFGPGPYDRLDIVLPKRAPAGCPVHVFVHGGLTRGMSKTHAAAAAAYLASRGIIHVAIDYAVPPRASTSEAVDQVRRAIIWCRKEMVRFGGDPARIQLAGHSTGAHLAACVAGTDWGGLNMPENVLHSVVLVSGLYDLEPLRLSHHNALFGLGVAEAYDLSPLHHPPLAPRLPVLVASAASDSDEYLRQADALVGTWRAGGADLQHVMLSGRNHFDGALDFADPKSQLGRNVLRLLDLEA